MKVKIHKGDMVEIISGGREDKGKRGEVIRVLPDEGVVAVVLGLHHVDPRLLEAAVGAAADEVERVARKRVAGPYADIQVEALPGRGAGTELSRGVQS